MSATVTVSLGDERTFLTLYAAARRAFSRQLDVDAEILAAAFVCTGWRATAAFKIKAPLACRAVALKLDPATAAERMSAYKKVEARERAKCARAKAHFVDVYRQFTGEDLSEFDL